MRGEEEEGGLRGSRRSSRREIALEEFIPSSVGASFRLGFFSSSQKSNGK